MYMHQNDRQLFHLNPLGCTRRRGNLIPAQLNDERSSLNTPYTERKKIKEKEHFEELLLQVATGNVFARHLVDKMNQKTADQSGKSSLFASIV